MDHRASIARHFPPETNKNWINELVLLAISHQKMDQRVSIARHLKTKWINALALLAISHPKRAEWINELVLLAISHG